LTWESILKRNRGKLIYFDFWASCCVPCRQEMPYSLKLRSDYSDKNIVFIYISLDKKRTNWQNAVKELGIPTNNNYLLLDTRDSKLLDHLSIKTIPKYILINNQGEVIDLDVPRPSSKSFIPTINEYLKKGI